MASNMDMARCNGKWFHLQGGMDGQQHGYVKAGEGSPQAREEEGKLPLLSTEHSSSPAGIPGIWGLQLEVVPSTK